MPYQGAHSDVHYTTLCSRRQPGRYVSIMCKEMFLKYICLYLKR